MDRNDWQAWREARGVRKRALLAKLLTDNESLARYYVGYFARRSSYYTANMEDDLLQAARIGIIRALPAWEPDKGGFSAVAFQWARHEIQLVLRHASRISVPKSAFLPKAKQDAIARFEAAHGRHPEPAEVGLTAQTVERARKAEVEIVDVSEADEVPSGEDTEGPEARIDRKRDVVALQEFVATLSKRAQKAFWAGERPDLNEKAKTYVEGKRGR